MVVRISQRIGRPPSLLQLRSLLAWAFGNVKQDIKGSALG
jgi:hypothetical protein